VDIPAERAMNKRQMDLRPDLIGGDVVIEVGADSPEVLIRIDDLHPTAPW
jgi:hypothetical protein